MTDLVVILAEQTGVDVITVSEWLEEELIVLPEGELDDEVLERARRIRRLTELGVNLPGVEIILHMRTEIFDYQTQIGKLEEDLRLMQHQHEAEIARLTREFSS